MFSVLYPLLLTACTIGNVLNLVLLISTKRQKTTNAYMIAVAIADIIVLSWTFFPPYLWNTSATLHLPYKNRHNWAIVSAALPYTIWIQETFIQMCDWVLTAFSLERLLAIARPFTFKWVQRATTARIVIIVLLLFSIVFNSGNFLREWYLWRYTLTIGTLPAWLKDWTKAQDAAEVVVSFLKFFGLLCINVLVIGALNRQQRSDIGQQRSAQAVTSLRRSKSSNHLLLGSVALYLTTLLPSMVYKFLEMADTYKVYNFDPSAKLFATPFCDVTMLTNYSVNFFLYLTVSENYRVQFMRLFGECCARRG
ncbi:probable G-protein coupled receptor B0563.6 [Paramacrobiotus metropolitanus]|uniref:probable G-protein coupled receptor B0563.6 n=1 Tax=Paramacrobiotus metropolitanus TaxID=2943436 RepID=UPI0024458115|nr:probable G-protein coupled receptor B0563.6 [Paramacrobiotus metropolitanus]